MKHLLLFIATGALLLSSIADVYAMDVQRWLDDVGLSQYVQNFADKAVNDESTISTLTDEDLKSIGISILGHRKQLLSAIANLKESGWNPDWDTKYWLESLGLVEYHELFVSNAADTKDSILLLSEDDLKEIGISVLGHRKKIVESIAALKTSPGKSASAPKTQDPESGDDPPGNILIEVHQSHRNTDLWYHVGIVDHESRSIDWGDSHRYDKGRIPMCDF